MRGERAAHDIERVAIAAVGGVEPRQHLQRLDLGLVAAPDGGERLQLRNDVVALEIADRVAQQGLAQLALRRGAPVPRVGCRLIGGERVLVAAHALGEPADQHRHRRLELMRDADSLEIVELDRGGGEIADFDGRAHFFLQRDALQLDRQRRHRGVGALEAVARLPPFALLGVSQRPPQRRIVLIADRRIGEILQRVVGAIHHDLGHRAQHRRGALLRGRAVVGERDVEHALGLGIHVAGDIEAGEIEPRRQALVVGRRRRRRDQLRLPLDIRGLLIETP